jgi:hypothetical protein
MGPSSIYSEAPSEGEGSSVPSQESPEAPAPVSIQEVLLEEPPLPCAYEQYVVHLGNSEGEEDQPHPVGEEVAATQQNQRVGGGEGGRGAFRGSSPSPLSLCAGPGRQPQSPSWISLNLSSSRLTHISHGWSICLHNALALPKLKTQER